MAKLRQWTLVPIGLVMALFLASPASASIASGTPEVTATFDGVVSAAIYSGNTIYVAGEFTHAYAAGRTYGRGRMAAIDATTGALLPWNPKAGGPVRGLAISGSTVFAVGDFATMGGVSRHHLAAVTADTGAVLATFANYVNGVVYTAAVGNGRLYIGGRVTSVDGVVRGGAAAFSLTTGALDSAWLPVLDDRVEAIAVTASRVYLGGLFRTVNTAGTGKLAAVDPVTGAPDVGFQPVVSAVVHAIAVTGTNVYAGVGGTGGRVMSLDLAGAERWRQTTDGDVQAVVVLDGVIYFGGHFDHACLSAQVGAQGVCLDGSAPRFKLAAAGLDGGLLTWAPTGNGSRGVYAMATQPAPLRLAAGGAFTTINGLAQKRFAQFRLS